MKVTPDSPSVLRTPLRLVFGVENKKSRLLVPWSPRPESPPVLTSGIQDLGLMKGPPSLSQKVT